MTLFPLGVNRDAHVSSILVKDQTELGRRFGRTLRDMRMNAGVAQAALAERMVRHGFPSWRQSTVAKTESGERPLLAAEMFALIDLLGVDRHAVVDAVASNDDEQLAQRLVEAECDVFMVRQAMNEVEDQLIDLRTRLAIATDRYDRLRAEADARRTEMELATRTDAWDVVDDRGGDL